MDLLIDVGNTRVKYAKVENNQLSAIEHCSIEEFFEQLDTFSKLNSIFLVSVSNQSFSNKLQSWAQTHSITFKTLLTEAETFGVKNSYQQYSTMGADRWLAVLGAQLLFPNNNVLIVDAGTATTFDLLNKEKQHCGGWIIPGVELMMQSLFDNTDKVFGKIAEIERTAFGQTTNDNVNLGCWSATTGAINNAISQAKQDGVQVEQLIFTGGNGKELNRLGKFNGIFIADLIFQGMKRYIQP
ncbi:type III pantothenate kinase [Thalassotalea sp. ND16A]|uniref:type III pantothenate kinase n=1 Tax=Thalassotalea sp. ND16A TaxID=1535422 RepID=UPI00051DF384|nr:type III pantothenate kinase [Thalassotalea sp. ND16A]KGJ92164.1 hypothetical protein ND16A_1683 [Thalassotalea sp. ND16A]